jgi:putative sigma-54 modulation protein
VRTKTFEFLAMHADEAIDQMELLEHDFFVFQDAMTGNTNVVYRRNDGAYGLIKPERP